jgi:hypothetical protein
MLAADFVSLAEYFRILDALATKEDAEPADDAYAVELCGMLLKDEGLTKRHDKMIRQRLNGVSIAAFGGNDEVLLGTMASALGTNLVDNPNETIAAICERVAEWPLNFDDFHLLGKVVSFGHGSESISMVKKAKQCITDYWAEFIEEYVAEKELLRGIYHEQQFEDGQKELFESVNTNLAESGLTFDAAEVTAVCKKLEMDRIADRNIEWDSRSDYDPGPQPDKRPLETEDELIDDMFERDLPPKVAE